MVSTSGLWHLNWNWFSSSHSYRKESSSSSSMRLQVSAITIWAFRWYNDRFLPNCRAESKWANRIDRPKSAAFVSHGVKHDVTNVDDGGRVMSGEEIFEMGQWELSNIQPTPKLPIISLIDRSLNKMYGSKCGTVVLGACGFEQLFMHLSIGLSFASKLNALSVYFCRSVCQVVSNFWICKLRQGRVMSQLQIFIAQMTEWNVPVACTVPALWHWNRTNYQVPFSCQRQPVSICSMFRLVHHHSCMLKS